MVQATPFRFENSPHSSNLFRPSGTAEAFSALFEIQTGNQVVPTYEMNVKQEPVPTPVIVENKAILDYPRIKSMAEYVFGADRVMATKSSSLYASGEVTILDIHFPEIQITNSKGKHHTIRNLFTRLRITPNPPDPNNINKCNITFRGARTEFSLKELNAGYSHSHMYPGIGFPNQDWFTFCLGASDFAMIIENTKIHAEEEDWLSLFFGMESYLSWESLEGGPYVPMGDIDRSTTSTVNVQDGELSRELDRIYSKMPFHIWEYTPHGFNINPENPDVIEFFNEHSTIRKRRTVIQGGNPASYYDLHYRDRSYRFKDKWFKLVITPGEEEEKKKVDGKPEPVEHYIIQQYCQLLEGKIYSFTKKYLDASIAQGKDFVGQTRVLEQA